MEIKSPKRIKKIISTLAVTLALLILSLPSAPSVYSREQEIPVVELERVERRVITPEMREARLRHNIRELQRFLLGHWLGEEITIKEGIYFTADSVFNIRRIIPDIPFKVSFANAAGYRDLRLRRIRIYGPDEALLESFDFMEFLPSAKQEFDQIIALQKAIREKGEEFFKEAKPLLVEKEMSEEERERLEEKLFKEFGEALSKIVYEQKEGFVGMERLGEKMQHISTSIDLTPYLRKPGDEAIITVRAIFNIKTVKFPFTFRLDPPLPSP